MLKKQYSKDKPVCKVTFSLPAEMLEGRNEVKVLGDFNGWNWNEAAQLKLSGAEYKAVVELTAGQSYAFRYLADQLMWITDPAADAYVASPYGVDNAVVVVEAHAAPVKETAPKAKTEKAAPAPKAKAAAPKAKTDKPVAEPKKAAKAVKAEKPAKSAKTAKDDLAKIEGIGPKIAELLQAKGILTFEALAATKTTTLKEILDAAGSRFQIHDPSTWAQQAKLAAKGEWDKLTKLQDKLKGGKKA